VANGLKTGIVLGGVILGVAVGAAFADPIVVKGTGLLDGLPVSASATFTLTTGSVLVTLENLVSNPKSVVQNISALRFTLDASTASAVTSSSSGVERTVSSKGTYTDGENAVAAGWKLSTPDSRTIELNDLARRAAGPAHTILGAPDSSTLKYGAANSGIAGNGPHNPFLWGPVKFELLVPRVTPESILLDVVFSFGTTQGRSVPGKIPEYDHNQTTAPEPSSLVLLATGCVVAAFALRKRKA